MAVPGLAKAQSAIGTSPDSGDAGSTTIAVTSTATANPERPIKPRAGSIRTFAGGLAGTAGNIRTFTGELEADAGSIRTFAGSIRTFAGSIRTFQAQTYPSTGLDPSFWGTLQPLAGTLAPSAGNIRTFAGDFEAQAGAIRTFASDPTAATAMLGQISNLVDMSQATWGAAVQQRTGKSFAEAFTTPMLGKYGINLSDPTSLSNLNEATLELFLLDWNDNLMNYSGVDQTDHWMKAVNWSPSLTQQVISGGGSKIGILDFTIGGDSAGNIVSATGVSTVDGGHGTAVAGLIVAPHDGRGIMGIAPTASIVSFNPFDATMTAGWADIKTGLSTFADAGVSVVNMSLGVPGWTLNEGWNTVFTEDKLFKAAQSQVFVLAAGNDGVVQPASIEWRTDRNPTIIVVGSVDPNGVISAFSNTPGTACLLKDGKCQGESSLLMNRFMVAPGEFILLDDGHGGVTRMSGTSFAAPLVSGTAALIVDRWPWLAKHPTDVADIILNSATDLGSPGVDPVYGHGMLNVAAALAPQSFSGLKWKVSVNGVITNYSATSMATNAIAQKATWEAAGAYVTVFDDTPTSYRDFIIPLSSKLTGQTVGTSQEQFNAYLQSRFWAWAQATASTSTKSGFASFSDAGASSPFLPFGALQASLMMKPRVYAYGRHQQRAGIDSALTLQTPDQRLRLGIGNGSGAAMLHGMTGFAIESDYDLQSGGANPFMGLASGSGYASVDYRVGARVSISGGFTYRGLDRDRQFGPAGRYSTDVYAASAYSLRIAYRARDWLSASLGYTLLDEEHALLGMQSADANDFRGGARTDVLSAGIEVTPDNGFALAASATVGRTRPGSSTSQSLVAGSDGIVSSAFQVSLAKAGVLSGHDSLRLSLAQPMHLERGSIDFNSVAVVDRQTGELGVVTQHIGLKAFSRTHVAEAIYRLPLSAGNGSFSFFGRYRMGTLDQRSADARVMAGLGFTMRY